ncbi:hypothetical protein Tco_1564990 [Tanacetum coccineum]
MKRWHQTNPTHDEDSCKWLTWVEGERSIERITGNGEVTLITKSVKESHINIKLAESEEIVDLFEGVTVTWKYRSDQQQNLTMAGLDNNHSFVQEKKYMELKFDKK